MRAWASFDGRLGRRSFWGRNLALWTAFAAGFVLLESVLGRPATLLLYPPFYWSLLALLVRRLHDRERSALWLLVLLVPVLGPLFITLDAGLRRGTRGTNRYGPDPREPTRRPWMLA